MFCDFLSVVIWLLTCFNLSATRVLEDFESYHWRFGKYMWKVIYLCCISLFNFNI